MTNYKFAMTNCFLRRVVVVNMHSDDYIFMLIAAATLRQPAIMSAN